MDVAIMKMLFLHLPTRHPNTYPELEISPLVQAAALVGVGLLFEGTGHRGMAEIMMEEIGRRPGSGSKETDSAADGINLLQGVTQDREGYALAAGLALGFITAGKGKNTSGSGDGRMEERLRYFINGGAESGNIGTQRGLAAAAGKPLAGGSIFGPGILGFDPTLGEPELRFSGGGIGSRDPGGVRGPGGAVADELAAAQGSSQTVGEGDLVNMGVTGPAAAVALGLMYSKTNNAAVGAMFMMPDSQFALDLVLPEHLMIRVWMRSLVMWDRVQPSWEWIMEQLPSLFRGPLSQLLQRKRGLTIDLEAVVQVTGIAFPATTGMS
jgi:anaphase-promoting complex subunit 1